MNVALLTAVVFRAEFLEGLARGHRTWSCYCFEHKGVVTPGPGVGQGNRYGGSDTPG